MRARSMQTPNPGGRCHRTLHELQTPDRSRASHTGDRTACRGCGGPV